MRFLALTLALACLCDGGHTAQWTPSSPQDGDTVYACRGHNVTLAWGYTLSAGDVLGDIQWDLDGVSQEMVAVSVRENFLTMPAFANRVEEVDNAGIIISKVTVADSGNYSIELHIYRDSGVSHSVMSRSVNVQISDQLMTQDGSLHASQSPEAVLDSSTDQWAIQLQCGVFTFRAAPSFQLEWITPSGQTLTSSDYSDGHFNLLLKSPLQGGNYTCRVPPQHAGDVCLHGNAAHRGEATVYVDKVDARLSLLEKENEQLREQLKQSNAELTQTKAELKFDLNHTNSQLTQTEAELTTRMQIIEARVEGQQVGFHATFLQSSTPPDGSPLVFRDVLYNVGNAYSNTTGYFTAPRPGLFFFMSTSGPADRDGNEEHDLYVEDTLVSYAYARNQPSLTVATAHAVVHLTTGQRVWVRSGGDHYDMSYTSFSGALLSPDF